VYCCKSTQHTKSITEQTTEHKMWQRGNNSYIIYRKLTDHASYLVAFQYNVLQKITVISVSRYTEENSYSHALRIAEISDFSYIKLC
jgi:hypothetical protein